MTTERLVASVLDEIVSPKGQKISDYDEKIFESGLIDSFGIIEFVLALEKKFEIAIPTTEMTIQNFSSVTEISRLIERLKNG